jgi:hypothetical protein
LAPTTSLSTRAGFASQGPSARVTDRMSGTSDRLAKKDRPAPSVLTPRRPLRRRGSSTVKRNASMRTGNHAPPGTSEPWSSSARDACPATDKGDDCGQAGRPSSDRLAVARLRVVLAMHRLDARAAAGETGRTSARSDGSASRNSSRGSLCVSRLLPARRRIADLGGDGLACFLANCWRWIRAEFRRPEVATPTNGARIDDQKPDQGRHDPGSTHASLTGLGSRGFRALRAACSSNSCTIR